MVKKMEDQNKNENQQPQTMRKVYPCCLNFTTLHLSVREFIKDVLVSTNPDITLEYLECAKNRDYIFDLEKKEEDLYEVHIVTPLHGDREGERIQINVPQNQEDLLKLSELLAMSADMERALGIGKMVQYEVETQGQEPVEEVQAEQTEVEEIQ